MSKSMVDVVGEIVRRKTKEKGSCSREELENQIQELDDVAEERRENGKIDFSSNRNWLSWKIIDARKDGAYIHVEDDRGNRVEAGESGKLPGSISKMIFNEEKYDIDDSIINLSNTSEDAVADENYFYDQYTEFRTTGWSKGEAWKFEALEDYQGKIDDFNLSGLDKSEVREIVEFWDKRREGKVLPAFVMGQRFGGETWKEFSNRVNSSSKAADVLSNLLDDERDLESRLDLFYDEFGDIDSASGGPLLTLATFFLGYTYPEKYIIYRHDYVIEPINDLFDRANISKNQGYNLTVYEKVREYSEIVSGKLDNRLQNTTYLDVWDFFYFYKEYRLPEEAKLDIEGFFDRARNSYTRIFALKVFLEKETDLISKKILKSEIRDRAREEAPGDNPNVYASVGTNIFDQSKILAVQDEDYILEKEYRDFRPHFEHFVDYLWRKSDQENEEQNLSGKKDYTNISELNIQIPDSLYFENKSQLTNEIEASLNSGKNIIFTGPPGTGKTKLAKSISRQVSGEAEEFEGEESVEGSVFTTATADWTAFDTIGGYMPSQGNGDELEFNPGQFLKCFRNEKGEVTNKWLVIDEINRSDIDKAFGQLFSVLSGDSVELPYKKDGHVKLEKVEEEQDLQQIESDDDVYPVTDSWRLIATMNTYDKTSLYDMSYAFMRRFNFVHVGVPDLEKENGYKTELLNPEKENYSSVWDAEDVLSEDDLYEDLTVLWAEVNRQRDIGPSIIKDIIEFIDAHNGENKIALAQAVNSLILPQFEGLRREKQKEFVRKLKEKEEQNEISLEVSLVEEKASNMFNISFEDEQDA